MRFPVLSSNWRGVISGSLIALATVATCQTFIKVDPKGAFLRTNNDGPNNPTVVALTAIGLTASDWVQIAESGDFDYGPGGDVGATEHWVFSSSNTVLATSLQNRIPGAISCGLPFATGSTYYGGLPTDIPEDFGVPFQGAYSLVVKVPNGAQFLFAAPPDSLYNDNTDPDNDYGFTYRKLPKVSAHVDLQQFLGAVSTVPLHVEVSPPGGPASESYDVFPDASGNFNFPCLAPGTYDLSLKATHWLRQRLASVVVTAAGVSGVNFSLSNGDVDGDNEVTLADYSRLASAFLSVPGDSNWNADADLNGDEEVSLADYAILAANFGQAGDS